MNTQGLHSILVFSVLLLGFGCKRTFDGARMTIKNNDVGNPFLFEIMDDSITGIKFSNSIVENTVMNGFNYEYLYNGAGVSVGDVNNDNLPDIYFASSLEENQLYLNKGNLTFDNVTLKSMVGGGYGLHQGTTMVDINFDGKMDIYICKSGAFKDADKRRNELYVNMGNDADGIPVFKEEAKRYRLDLPHYSTQAAFFDYDKDGDLDMFLLNHNIDPNSVLENMEELRHQKSDLTSDRLFRNEDGTFIDVSDEAKIMNDGIGFGLGVAIGDLNNDSWPDIIVGHDYTSKDRMYLNQGNGTFKEIMNQSTGHISTFSMGNDIADFNNDGWMDFISLDMVAEDNYGIKASMSGMNPKQFNYLVEEGFHYQYMYNTVQLNNGVESKKDNPVFSDIAFLTGTSSTDWSWGPLFFDMDNDGDKDLFVSNGIKRDFRNVDYIKYRSKKEEELNQKLKEAPKEFRSLLTQEFVMDMLKKMPTRKKDNYFYENKGELSFSKQNSLWAPSRLAISNGAAYADLDNDGDLDIVTNNMDEKAFIYSNNTSELETRNYLKINLKGSKKNTNGIGAKVTISIKDKEQVVEQHLSRGFQSSIDKVLHFGLGTEQNVDKVKIVWPDNKTQILTTVNANQIIELDYKEAYLPKDGNKKNALLFNNITDFIQVQHFSVEGNYNDFELETLLPHKMSEDGPALTVGDVNDDGRQDFYIGGSKGTPGTLYFQEDSGNFKKSIIQVPTFERDRFCEDVDAEFFDADSDGDLDLYVVSGSNEDIDGSKNYTDRVYININGKFHKQENPFHNMTSTSGSVVRPYDFDQDGDMDLFVGGRQSPGKYPYPGKSFLLRNDTEAGNVLFTNIGSNVLNNLGMVTDAKWVDIDGDKIKDLIVVGEWMFIKVFKNNKNSFLDITQVAGLENQSGWWFSIEAADFDNDGDMDFVAGNLGMNSKYLTTETEPFQIFASDFDETGTIDVVLGYHQQGKLLPLRGRECSSNQMPFIKDKFATYHEFALATLEDVYGKENLDNALNYKALNFSTTYFENMGNARFKAKNLPNSAQLTTITKIISEDVDNDGNLDMVLLGNMYGFEVETPRQDAGYGLLLMGNGKGDFKPVMPYESGLYVIGDVVDAKPISIGNNKKVLIIAKNKGHLQFEEINADTNL